MRQTKIICTLGPASEDEKTIRCLIDAGMNIARLNGSHANLDWHKKVISLLRSIDDTIPILFDIPGRKIRTIGLDHEPVFSAGESIILTTDLSYDGRTKVPLNYSNLHNDLTVGARIMADDGMLEFEVIALDGRDIHCKAKVSGKLRSKKGINVPFVVLNTPQVTDRDIEVINFACNNSIDYLGISFVESADHVESIRSLINSRGPKIVAKIENGGGLNKMGEIIKASDAIMIDRGDLSVETSLEEVTINQKKIIQQANKIGVPVIVATEVLHSMIENPQPTKAEISDITNAVIDGCAAIMLSGETAVGSNGLAAVRTMSGVINASESFMNQTFGELDNQEEDLTGIICKGILEVVKQRRPSKIVAITRSGFAARRLSSMVRNVDILAVTDDQMVVRGLNMMRGVTGILFDKQFPRNSSDHFLNVLEMLWHKKIIDIKDEVIVTGISYPTKGSRMNTIQIYSIQLLIEEFKWVQ